MKPIHPLLTALLATALSAPAAGQMVKRYSGLYDADAFALEAPRIGQPAPDLRLFDLDGRPRSLRLERGRVVVLIAGSYT